MGKTAENMTREKAIMNGLCLLQYVMTYYAGTITSLTNYTTVLNLTVQIQKNAYDAEAIHDVLREMTLPGAKTEVLTYEDRDSKIIDIEWYYDL